MNVTDEIKVAIADDHDIFRDGLKALLKKVKPLHLQILGDVNSGAQIIELVENNPPHLIFMDVQMPDMDGVIATQKIKSINPNVKVIALTTFNNPGTVRSMLEAGVDGYLLKSTTRDEIVEAIVTVYKGGNFFTLDAQVQWVTKDYFISKDVASGSTIKFTDQERMVLTYICQEMSIKEIATAMRISVRTVETYRKRIMEKVGAKGMAGLVAYALLKGEVRI